MENPKNINLELWNMKFEKLEFLTDNQIQTLDKKRKHLTKLNSLETLVAILVVFTLLIDDYSHNNFMLLLVGGISISTIVYIITSRIYTKDFIKRTIIPTQLKNNHSIKYKLHYNRYLDKLSIVSLVFLCICTVIAIIRGLYGLL